MKVSVLIPTKNAGKQFEQVIDCVINQKIEFDFELVIVDSGSKDNTIKLIETKQKSHKNIKLIQIDSKDFQHGRTRNLGIKNSSGEFVALITQDSLPVNDMWLTNLIMPFENDPKVSITFGKHLPYSDTYPVEKKQIVDHFEKGFGNSELVFEIKDKNDYKQRQGWYIFSSNNNACVRKSTWEKIPFREVRMGEDQFIAKDMLESGFKKVYVPNAIVYHSHKYSFGEIIKRYYDEYRFHVDVGNMVKANLKDALGFYLRSLKQSFIIILKSDELSFLSKIYFLFFYIIYDLARSFGYYKGTNGSDLDDNKYSMQTEIINK